MSLAKHNTAHLLNNIITRTWIFPWRKIVDSWHNLHPQASYTHNSKNLTPYHKKRLQTPQTPPPQMMQQAKWKQRPSNVGILSLFHSKEKKVKPWCQDWLIVAGPYPGFYNMKRLEVFLLPLDAMLVHCRSLPCNLSGFPNICWYPFIHLSGERHCES